VNLARTDRLKAGASFELKSFRVKEEVVEVVVERKTVRDYANPTRRESSARLFASESDIVSKPKERSSKNKENKKSN
jgi:hypothetical protein